MNNLLAPDHPRIAASQQDWFDEVVVLLAAARVAFLHLALSRDEKDLAIAKQLQAAIRRAEGR